MKSSTFLKHKGVIFDANVLSLLAKEDHLDLLSRFFVLPRYITPAIEQELVAGLRNGVSYLKDVLQLVETGHLEIVSPTVAERQFMKHLPAKLGTGEAEAIVICQQQKMVFITHDRKAANYCDRTNISCVRLSALLLAWQNAGLLTASEVKNFLSD